jgi:16S rRNA processing protein RimM
MKKLRVRSRPEPPEQGLVVGVVTKPHGVRGELRVRPYDQSSDTLGSVEEVTLEREGKPQTFRIESARRDRKWFIVHLEGVDTRSAAEELRSAEVMVTRDQLPELQPDEFYLADCIGCRAVDGSGEPVGMVEGVEENPAHEQLVISSRGQELLLPCVPRFVKDVRLDTRQVIVEVPEGLPWSRKGSGPGKGDNR